MKNLLPNFHNARVLVLGDVMLDRYWQGSTSRISPEAPVPVVNIKGIDDRAGGAANVALGMTTLGTQVSLLGVVGADENGQILKNLLEQAKISHQLAIEPNIPTITKLRIISRHQQLIRLDFEENIQLSSDNPLLKLFTQQLAKQQVVVLSDYGKGTIKEPQPFIQAARAAGLPVLIDPKGTDFTRYRGATLLTDRKSVV